MLTFTPVTQRDIARLRRYYKSCEYQLCEYSALVKLMWRSHLHPSWAEGAGCLIVRNFIDGQYCFDYPVPGPDGDEDAALALIEDDCRERDIPLVLSVVPQDKAERLAARYPYFRFSSPRVWRDYIYAAEDLRDFAGRRYSGQRNHINKFRKLYPDAAFRPLGKSDLPLITQFFRDYEAVFTKASDSAKNELRCAEKMLRMTGSPHFLVGGMELDGRLLSVAMAERCGDTLQIHIEKALYGYEGVYPATVQAFAQEFAVDGVRWLNREDDAGDKGLRTSKLQYLPDHLGAKLRFDVLNELVNITEIPTLTTARLTLDALTDADKTAYATLCLDDDRNRWWGYDFRKDYDGTPYEDYFLAVAREDYARSRAVNFAVRLDGALIGEVVLYRFDSRGGAELGCRATATARRRSPPSPTGRSTGSTSPTSSPNAIRKTTPPTGCSPPVCTAPARMRPSSILIKRSEPRMKRPPLHTIVQRRFFVFTQKIAASAARRQAATAPYAGSPSAADGEQRKTERQNGDLHDGNQFRILLR